MDTDTDTPGLREKSPASSPAAPCVGRVCPVIALGAACALAAAPAATGLVLLEQSDGGVSPRSAALGWGVLGVSAVLGTVAALLLRRRVPLRPPWRAVLALWTALAVLAFTDAALARIAPFRVGLLSVALYLLPALLIATALRACRLTTMTLFLAAASGVPIAVADPVGALQQDVAAAQWMDAQGITSRQLLQIVDLPGLIQEPFEYDRATGQLTAIFHQDEDWLLPPIDLAAETITPGDRPCAPVLITTGDAQDQQTPHGCEPTPDGLWRLDLGNGTAGFAREVGGVTIAITGPQDTAPQVLLAARTADDAQLFTRIAPGPFTLTDWLLL